MDQRKTGEFIARERRALSLTQAELADKLHISAKTVSRWETGKGMPDVSLMMPLCDELGMSVNELLSGERLSVESGGRSADRNLLSLLREKAQRRKILGVVLTAVITLLLMVGLYIAEFSVDASSTQSLEAAIDGYSFHFQPDNESDVLETQTAGRFLFALYRIEGYDVSCGIAKLERGLLGRYRFIYSDQTNWPLYNAYADRRGGTKRLLIYAVNDLPEVMSFKLFSDSERTGDPIYEGAAGRTPFLRIIETETPQTVFPSWIRYYGADGSEISDRELIAEFTDKSEFNGGGTGSAELGLIYFFEALTLLLGIVFIRYFLGKTVRRREKAPEGADNNKQEADNEISDPGRADAGRDMRP